MYQHASAYNGRGASGPQGAACESSSIAARVDTMHCYHLAAFYSITFPPAAIKSRRYVDSSSHKKAAITLRLSFLSLSAGAIFLTTWISLTHPTAFFGPGIWVNRTWCFVNNSSQRARVQNFYALSIPIAYESGTLTGINHILHSVSVCKRSLRRCSAAQAQFNAFPFL
jgi:hypothetical protein